MMTEEKTALPHKKHFSNKAWQCSDHDI